MSVIAPRPLVPAASAFALLALATACSDKPTEPANPLVVTASLGTRTGPLIIDGSASSPTLVRCGAQVRLNVSGEGRSRFGVATIYRFTGADRSRPTDSLQLSPALVQQAFAATAIVPNVSLDAAWTLDDSVPFTGRIVVTHRVEGKRADDTVSVDAPCGPAPQAAGPQVSGLSVTGSNGPVEPGDTALVRFTVAAPSGLWRTHTRITGGCSAESRDVGQLQSSPTDIEVRLPLDPLCPLGQPLAVSVTVRDGAQRETVASGAAPALVDVTAPLVRGLTFVERTGILSGIYFNRDTVDVALNLDDLMGVRAIAWEWLPSGRRDSLVLTPRTPGTIVLTARIRVPDEETGSVRLRVTVRDSSGNASPAVTSADGAIRVYPTLARAPITTTIDGALSAVAIDANRNQVLVLQAGKRRVVALDRTTLAVARTIPLADSASAMDMTPGGDTLVLILPAQRAIGIVDLRDVSPSVAVVPLTGIDSLPGFAPSGGVTTARGTVLATLPTSNFSDARVVEVDLRTGATQVRNDAGTGPTLLFTRLSRSPDGRVVVIARFNCVRRWDVATAGFDACRDLLSDSPVSFSQSGAIAVYGTTLLNGALQPVRQLQPAVDPLPASWLSPDGTWAYRLVGSAGIARFRTSDGLLADRIPMSAGTLRVWPDGTALVGASGFGGLTTTISVIDPR